LTEFEIATLSLELANRLNADVMSFASILFAFIIAAFFFTHQLPRWILVILTLIYTIFLIVIAGSIFQLLVGFESLREEIALLPIDEIGPFVTGIAGVGGARVGYVLFALILVGSYIGSVLFLVYMTKAKNSADGT